MTSGETTAPVEGAAWTAAASGWVSVAVGEPGVLEELSRQAGLTPEQADEIEVPCEFPDRATLEHALLAIAPVYGVGAKLAEGWSARRSSWPSSRSGEPMAPTGSRTASGTCSPRFPR